jgi:hypothetical protein
MIIDQKSDLKLLRKAINSSLRMGCIVNMPDEDEARLIRILVDIEDELTGHKEPKFKIGSRVSHGPPHSKGPRRFGGIVEGPFDNGPYGPSWKVELLPDDDHPREIINVPEEHLQQRCNCCERGDEYNGFHTGPHLFECPKQCACHD